MILIFCFLLQLVSESVKAKQAQSVLLTDKQALAKQIQRTNATLESLKVRIAQGEDQVSFCLGTSNTSMITLYLFNMVEICSLKFT